MGREFEKMVGLGLPVHRRRIQRNTLRYMGAYPDPEGPPPTNSEIHEVVKLVRNVEPNRLRSRRNPTLR